LPGTAGVFGNALGGRRGAMIGGVIHGLFITFLPAILVPMLESYGFTGVTFSDSDVISSGLVLGHASRITGYLSPVHCFCCRTGMVRKR
jgi:PTS system ascorbate-specific IIC component